MANRYWVGGTETWNSTAGTKWASISGGEGGQLVPTSSDDVYFDANSGAITCTLGGAGTTVFSSNLDFTGFTGTIAGTGNISFSKNCTLASGATFSFNGFLACQHIDTSTYTLTSNGATIPNFQMGNTATSLGTLTLADVLSVTDRIFLIAGTLTTNNKNISCGRITANITGSQDRTFNMGSSTITQSGSGNSDFRTPSGAGAVTLNSGTSTMKFTSGVLFIPDSKTFYNLSCDGSSSIRLTGGTFNTVSISASKSLTIESGVTITLSSFTSGGTSGNLAVLQAVTAGSAFTLSDSSGTNSVSYMSIKDCTATGGATWEAVDSTNVSGNTGWVFSYTNTGAFLQFM